ncbi:hypothetical protein CLV85_1511 [Salinibacterium amurskyense]|uniref:YtxH-like protein n=1 Tax=Salinibacterium amurskyense TaxID=205941 RepID=A0A2M9D9H3_9MICO|nr:hypothetical protein [Salinibacterium amurskyense]PJJ82312.1 hypothetical protein CLV85_1511 [Salinibacterium amurskyense]RLQ82072.1 hypothetical protein D9C83_07515 [Salinibacterium amurskyense]GHD77407.1 hypothetical protein GCM10007394_03180 [Salinibacterium amurskyense]
MKGAVLFVAGIAVGFVAAHQVAKTPEGKQFFSDVDSKAREFTSAVVDGYREREAELRDAVADVEEAVSEFTKRS